MIVLLVVALLYLGALVGLTLFSVKPYRLPIWITLSALGHPEEEVDLVTSDNVRFRGSWSETPGSDKVAILLHGYMMNRSELTPEAHILKGQGFSTLLIDFRAHGASQYSRSGVGSYEKEEVKTAVQFVRDRIPNAKILLIGSSMGSAAIAFALADDPTLADAAVIDSAYGKLNLAISGWWKFLGGNVLSKILFPLPLISQPITGLNAFKVDVAKAIAKIGPKPLLFVHGSRDSLAIPSEAKRNYEIAIGPKKMVWFEGYGHSEGRWRRPDLYHEALTEWLKEIDF